MKKILKMTISLLFFSAGCCSSKQYRADERAFLYWAGKDDARYECYFAKALEEARALNDSR